MAGAPAGLPAGVRLSDHISLGVIARAVPPERVRQVLAETGKASERERDLPAQVMVYYAIALALYMGSSTREVLRCLLEGLRWLWGAEAVKVAGKSGISQARSRLGRGAAAPALRGLVQPIATRASKGAWYRRWRLVSLDGSCLDVADTEANRAAFGCRAPAAARAPSRSCASWRWWRTARTCCSAPAWAATPRARRRWPERAGGAAAGHAVPGRPAVLRHALWRGGGGHGADLLWRGKHNLRLPRERCWPTAPT
jgi:hypothetical protein